MILTHLKTHWGFYLILLLFLGLALVTSFRAPLDTGPDEVVHFMLARFIRTQGYLPFTPEDRMAAGYKSDQPPLNAVVVAAASFWHEVTAPPLARLTRESPRRYLADNVDNYAAWRVLHTEDPIAGEILFWYLGRWLSLVFSGLTLIVIYRLGLLIFEDKAQPYLWAWSTVAVVAFIPTFVLISAVLNYEALLGLWLSLYLLVAAYLFKGRDHLWLYFLAGLLIGLGIVTKLSALPAPISLVMLLIFIGWRAGWPYQGWFSRLGLGLMGLLLAAGWWFGLVAIQINQGHKSNWIADLLQPIIAGDGSDVTSATIVAILSNESLLHSLSVPTLAASWRWIRQLFETFWSLRITFPQGVNLVLLGLALLILFGLVQGWRQKRELRPWLAFLGGHTLLFLILPFIRFVVTGPHTAKGQHLLFPAVSAFALLMVWGLSAWLQPLRWRASWLGGLLFGGVMFTLSIFQAVQIYQAPLPVRTVPPEMSAAAKTIEADFGLMSLTGYGVAEAADKPGCCDAALPVHLYWEAQALADQDYLTEVRLINSQGQTKSLWLGHPADGRYPTRAWEPGDYIHDQIWLPLAGLEADTYTVQLRLLGRQGPLPLNDGEHLKLTEVTLTQARPLPEPSFQADDGPLYLWRQGVIQRVGLTESQPVLPEFQSQTTIQIVSKPEIKLNLIGPDRVIRPAFLNEAGNHLFIVDLNWPDGEYRLLRETEDQAAVEIGPILVAHGKGRRTQPSESQVKVEANFANQLKLLGYNLPRDHFAPGEHIPITLHLQALQVMPADFIMFGRLLDPAGMVWGRVDRRPLELYSTLLWAKDEVVEDGFTIQVDPHAPSGAYYLNLGFYLPVEQTAISLPLVEDGKMQETAHVTIGPLMVDLDQPPRP